MAAQVVFHAERGLQWVALAQKHQHALATALFNWSCATVTVGFYATFLPALVCESLRGSHVNGPTSNHVSLTRCADMLADAKGSLVNHSLQLAGLRSSSHDNSAVFV